MKSMFLVRSEHLTHQGQLFGGDLMAEIDTIGYCLLREKYGEKTLVTRAAEIEFKSPARMGDVITFEAKVISVGNTSVQVQVTGNVGDRHISTAKLIYVNVGPDGKKQPLRSPVPPTAVA
jgi:acyl-CoA thioesterase YciA